MRPFPQQKGSRQLRWGDIRGFESPAQAAFAARGTTYVCAYKACSWDKVPMERHTAIAEKKKRMKFGNAYCPAYRADFYEAKYMGFKQCHAICDVDPETWFLECHECFYKKQLKEYEAKEAMFPPMPLMFPEYPGLDEVFAKSV